MKFLHLVWSNLGRKKIRTLLTTLSILIAFLLFGYLGAIRQALDMGVSLAGADRLVVRHKVSIIQLLPESYENRMERLESITDATHATWFGGVYQDPRNFFAQLAVKPDEYMAMYPEFLLPADQMQTWLQTRNGAVAGRATADRFGWEIGDRIPIEPTIWRKADGTAWEFDLVGIYDGADAGTDTTNFFFRYDYLNEARPEELRSEVGWYVVRVSDPEAAAETAGIIDAEFANSSAETRAETELAFLQGFAKQVGNVGAMMVGVLSAVFFTILLVAGNTMGQAVRERIQEIGVLKALGFTNAGVLGLVLGESVTLALVGGLGGLAIAWYLISLGDPTNGALPIFYLPRGQFAVGALLTLGLGVAAGLFPAVQALRLRAVDALRRK